MFPSTISSFNRPTPTDRLNSPSHSALHNTVSSAVSQIETVIGLSTSSAVGTLMYDIRSPASDGGGHVQSASKGGTGQTTFSKGDLLVAQSATVIAKLAVGPDGAGLVTDSSVAAGVKWGTPGGTKLAASGSTFSLMDGVEQSIFGVTIPGSLLGTSNVVRSKVFLRNYNIVNGNNMLFKGLFGGNVVASVIVAPTATPAPNTSISGTLEYTLIGSGTNTQKAIMELKMSGENQTYAASVQTIFKYFSATSSVQTSPSQTFGIVSSVKGTSDTSSLFARVEGYTVEKIV